MLSAQVKTETPGVTSPFILYEDAGLTAPGTISVAQFDSFSESASGKSFSVPGIDFSLGLDRRLEWSGFGAFALSKDYGERRFSAALDDSYTGLKVLLVTESTYRPAIAVKPMLELLGTPDGAGRAHVALPLIIEKDVGFCDLASTVGYITRGVAYGSLKCEWGGDGRVTPTVVFSASRMTQHVTELRDLGLNRSQFGGSIGVNVNLTRHWSIFLEAGRTLGRRDENSPTLEFTASIAYTGVLWSHKGNIQQQSATH
jgi:hypothetical protein